MDAAQQLQQAESQEEAAGAAHDAQAPAPALATAPEGPTAEQATAPTAPAQSERHLAAVPTPERTGTEPTRMLRRTQPKPEEGVANGAREERPARGGAEAETGDEGSSVHQARRFKRRWNAAQTAAEKAEALRYGVERGVPEAVELMRELKGDAQPKQDAQAPAASKAPAQATAAQGAAQPQAAAPATPEEPLIMGHTRKALARHAEQGAFVANLCEHLGKMAGWTAPPEPMKLFEGIPGVEPIDVTGNPKKQLAELITRELTAVTTKRGAEDSPMRRRAEIGVLMLGMAGPGLMPFGARLASAGMDKLVTVGRVCSRIVRKLVRR